MDAPAHRVSESAELRFRSLIDALPQIVMTSDENRRLNYANDYYENYTGITTAELPARWREAIHPDDLRDIDRSRAAGGQFEIEYRLRRRDGVYRWHVATTYQIPAEAGVAGWLAVAIDVDDRKRAEQSLRFLERAGTRLAQSLDLQTTFDAVLDLIVPELADWVAITLREDDGLVRTVAARHRDPAKAHLAASLVGATYFREEYADGTLGVFRTRDAIYRSQIGHDFIVGAVRERFVPVIEELGCESFLAVPIFAGEDVTGSMTIVSTEAGRHREAPDLRAFQELARRTSFAIANARRFEREHRVARTLQAAALPQHLPSVTGLRFDSYYRAGRSEALIGGDWYDALVTADGRVIVSVGDVAGSGLGAAVRMSTMRQVLRAAAHVSGDPVAMLELADRTLRDEDADAIVTAFVGIIDLESRSMAYASAGHLPPLIRTSDGNVTMLGTPGAPLGCGDLAGVQTSRSVALPPQSCVVLYTDGLIEWSRNIVEGEKRLKECFAALHPSRIERPAQALIEAVLTDRLARDDIAVMTVDVI